MLTSPGLLCMESWGSPGFGGSNCGNLQTPRYCGMKMGLPPCQPRELSPLSLPQGSHPLPVPCFAWPSRTWQVRGADGSKRQESKRGSGLEFGIRECFHHSHIIRCARRVGPRDRACACICGGAGPGAVAESCFSFPL